ncbi:MAG: hypothetical protein RL462_637 [Pseudomonadota bacterium]|jgi:uncharacterized MAPEG superfamily protein
MNFPIAAVLLAGVMPWICVGIAKAGKRNYDNHNPRQWLAQQTGYRARANAAQANCFEAFPLFAAGILLALYAEVPSEQVDLYAGIFIAARVAYIAFYLSDKDKLRSLAWLVGVGCSVALLVASMGD